MRRAGFEMTPFQHCMNPIICIGMSDGKYTEEELKDLKSASAKLATWFQLTEDQAWAECESLYLYIHHEVTKLDPRFIFLKVPISCALIHKNLKSVEGRNYVIRFLEDQATADGVLTDDERQLISMYSTIILEGGERAGIHV